LHKTQIKELLIKPETLKFIEEKVWGKPRRYGHKGKKILKRTAMAHSIRSRIDKWYLIKLQSFCKASDTVNRTNQQPTDWEKSSLSPHLIEG
jgi:hypothetical protein